MKKVQPELAVKVLDYVRDQGRVMTRDIVLEHGASPNTLSHLHIIGRKRPVGPPRRRAVHLVRVAMIE